jgi:hypothetical protein
VSRGFLVYARDALTFEGDPFLSRHLWTRLENRQKDILLVAHAFLGAAGIGESKRNKGALRAAPGGKKKGYGSQKKKKCQRKRERAGEV